jgi:hypothetical protein
VIPLSDQFRLLCFFVDPDDCVCLAPERNAQSRKKLDQLLHCPVPSRVWISKLQGGSEVDAKARLTQNSQARYPGSFGSVCSLPPDRSVGGSGPGEVRKVGLQGVRLRSTISDTSNPEETR